jgi:hypothetical protein
MFREGIGLWKQISNEEAQGLLVIHGTSYYNVASIMHLGGVMQPAKKRGYLHFCAATNSTTLDQMEQLREGTAYLILNMDRVVQEYQVFLNPVGTITLMKKGYFEHQLPRNYIQYAVDRQGQGLFFPDGWNHSWSTAMGEEPPEHITKFFTIENYPKNSILQNEELLEGLDSVHKTTSLALARLGPVRNHTHVPRTSHEPMFRGSVRTRAWSGRLWMLNPGEFDQDMDITNISIDLLSPRPASIGFIMIQHISDLLKTKRAPIRGTAETQLLDLLRGMGENEISIGLAVPEFKAIIFAKDYDNLPLGSIVREMAAEVALHNAPDVPVHSGKRSHDTNVLYGPDEVIVKANGHNILSLFYNFSLDPTIVRPSHSIGALGAPQLQDYILRAGSDVRPNAPAEVTYATLDERSRQDVLITYVKDFHEWAMIGHGCYRHDPTTGADAPVREEPMLQLMDESDLPACQENVKTLELTYGTETASELTITAKMQKSAVKELECFVQMDVQIAFHKVYTGSLLGHENEFSTDRICQSPDCSNQSSDSIFDGKGPHCVVCKACYCEQCRPASAPFCDCTQSQIAAHILHYQLTQHEDEDSSYTKAGNPAMATVLIAYGLPTGTDQGLRYKNKSQDAPAAAAEERSLRADLLATEGEETKLFKTPVEPTEFWAKKAKKDSETNKHGYASTSTFYLIHQSKRGPSDNPEEIDIQVAIDPKFVTTHFSSIEKDLSNVPDVSAPSAYGYATKTAALYSAAVSEQVEK